jgi:ABC-type bacteriocin/lantibiotic exporter with double-glycine peptidase domain
MPDKSNREKGSDIPNTTVDIEFENVSFIYPKSDKCVLESMSFKINKGEKIAIVGRNGAGKTTLVKLICGLYQPSKGTIRVGGTAMKKYNRDDYYSMISPVFQIFIFFRFYRTEYRFMRRSDINTNKLQQVIRLAGLRIRLTVCRTDIIRCS